MNRRLLLLVALLSSSGCYSYQPAKPGLPERAITSSSKSVLRVTLKDRGKVDIRDPQIVEDSVIGSDELGQHRVAFLLADVQKVETRNFNTGLAVMSVVLAGVGVLMLLSLSVSSNLDLDSR
jgi:hypothetical protein